MIDIVGVFFVIRTPSYSYLLISLTCMLTLLLEFGVILKIHYRPLISTHSNMKILVPNNKSYFWVTHGHLNAWVLSSCTGSKEPIQRTKQYTTANQWLLNKRTTMIIPLWTRTPGQKPWMNRLLNFIMKVSFDGRRMPKCLTDGQFKRRLWNG